MIATRRLGSFIVNLGHVAKIPRGEERVFRIAGTPIAVLHSSDGSVLATEPARPHKIYPVAVNDEGEILIGIEEVLAAR